MSKKSKIKRFWLIQNSHRHLKIINDKADEFNFSFFIYKLYIYIWLNGYMVVTTFCSNTYLNILAQKCAYSILK